MTHDELLAKIDEMDGILYIHNETFAGMGKGDKALLALRAVIELHKIILIKHLDDTDWYSCQACGGIEYPCETIEAIEKELG